MVSAALKSGQPDVMRVSSSPYCALSGDLRVAMRLVKEETRTIAELTPDDKRGDLLAYCASDRYAQLRERMGVAIPSVTKAAPEET